MGIEVSLAPRGGSCRPSGARPNSLSVPTACAVGSGSFAPTALSDPSMAIERQHRRATTGLSSQISLSLVVHPSRRRSVSLVVHPSKRRSVSLVVHSFELAFRRAPEARKNQSPRRKPWVTESYRREPRRGDTEVRATLYRPSGARPGYLSIPTAYAVGSGSFAPPALSEPATGVRPLDRHGHANSADRPKPRLR